MQINIERFYKYLDGFKKYIENTSGSLLFDLTTNEFFMQEEGYKHNVYSNAQKILCFDNWKSTDVGLGRISQKVIQAVDEGENLVYHLQKIYFRNKVTENLIGAEQILYNVYCGENDRKSFDDAVKFFGGKYDLIAYLFFIKNKNKYLPISPKNFDDHFEFLNISFKTSRKCNSENYFEFLEHIEGLKTLMEQYYGFEINLLDAHSVIWQLRVANNAVAHIEENNADTVLSHEVNDLLPKKEFKPKGYTEETKEKSQAFYTNGHKVYPRSRFVALNALYIADNKCEIEPSHESFIRKNSDVRYMEPHHLVPMAYSDEFEVSLDVEENIISLCSNCHNEIHYGKNAKELVTKLYEKRKDLLVKKGINITLEKLLELY